MFLVAEIVPSIGILYLGGTLTPPSDPRSGVRGTLPKIFVPVKPNSNAGILKESFGFLGAVGLVVAGGFFFIKVCCRGGMSSKNKDEILSLFGRPVGSLVTGQAVE